jgi:hypothetical protein
MFIQFVERNTRSALRHLWTLGEVRFSESGMAVAPLFLRRNALRLLRPTVLSRSPYLGINSKRSWRAIRIAYVRVRSPHAAALMRATMLLNIKSALALLHSDTGTAAILRNELNAGFLQGDH